MTEVTRNRLWNCKNEWQGDDVRILCVCSAGLLRSPTLARWLHRNFENVNTRAVGTSEDHALIPVDGVHLRWADVIMCADEHNFNFIKEALKVSNSDKEVHCLSIPDNFGFGNKELEDLIAAKFEDLMSIITNSDDETSLTMLKPLIAQR